MKFLELVTDFGSFMLAALFLKMCLDGVGGLIYDIKKEKKWKLKK